MRKLTYLPASLLFILIAACTKELNADLTSSIESNDENNAVTADTYLP